MSEYQLLALYFVAKQELCFAQTGMVYGTNRYGLLQTQHTLLK